MLIQDVHNLCHMLNLKLIAAIAQMLAFISHTLINHKKNLRKLGRYLDSLVSKIPREK